MKTITCVNEEKRGFSGDDLTTMLKSKLCWRKSNKTSGAKLESDVSLAVTTAAPG